MFEMRFVKSKESNSGYVLFITIILLVVLSAYTVTILTSEHMRTKEAYRYLNKLQATVLSYSGLNCAQAYIAGYEDRGVAWETEQIMISCKNGGIIMISARNEAGWLKVVSKGFFIQDTTVYEGILGQAPPMIASNALSLIHSSDGIVVEDLAKLEGYVATSGGRVVTKNSGVFNGKLLPLKEIDYSGKIIDKAYLDFNRVFDSLKKENSIICTEQTDMENILRATEGNVSKPKFVKGYVSIKNLSIMDMKSPLYVNGELCIEQSTKITDLQLYVKGKVTITDNSDMERCTIVSSGNVTIKGNALFNGTVICAETLYVSETSKVLYPSLLYLSSFGGDKGCRRAIIIKDNAEVYGTIATGIFYDNGSIPRISTGFRSHIEGIIICPEALMPYGMFRGCIYAGKIIYNTDNRNVYVNRLKEVSIVHRDVSLMTIPLVLLKDGISRYLRITRLSGDAL